MTVQTQPLTTVTVENHYRFFGELRSDPNLTSAVYGSREITDSIGELVEELLVNKVLDGTLSDPPQSAHVRVCPSFQDEPVVARLELELEAVVDGQIVRCREAFEGGVWKREAQQRAAELREDGTLSADVPAYCMLVALHEDTPVDVPLPPLQLPVVPVGTLADCGVQRVVPGTLDPDRPILIAERLVEEAVDRSEAAGAVEIGAAVAGKTVRLPEPLKGARSPIVTVLSTLLFDPRHSGEALRFNFDPSALAEAQRWCDLREQGESLLTVFHSHGWAPTCRNCNQNADCPLAEARPSLQDYQLLATLFPGKSTLMPIAGRKLGAEGRRPVLQVYAWRSGEMRVIRWQTYED